MSVIFIAGILPIFPPSRDCRPSALPPMGPLVIPPPRLGGCVAPCPLACPPCAAAKNGEVSIKLPPQRKRLLFICPPLFFATRKNSRRAVSPRTRRRRSRWRVSALGSRSYSAVDETESS